MEENQSYEVSKLYEIVYKEMLPRGNSDIDFHIKKLYSVFTGGNIKDEQLKKLFLRSIIRYIVSDEDQRKEEIWQMSVFQNAGIINYTEPELINYFNYLDKVIPKDILLKKTSEKTTTYDKEYVLIKYIFIPLYLTFIFFVSVPVFDAYSYNWGSLFIIPIFMICLLQFGMYIWNNMLENKKKLSDRVLGSEYKKAIETFRYFKQGKELDRDENEAICTIVKEVFVLTDNQKR
jgi:hypothetical protein